MPASPLARDPFDALGDGNRRAIVTLLGGGALSVQEIADELPISRPAVSRHLRLLREAGLVTEEPHGTRRIYRLHDAGVAAVRAYLEQVWGDAATRFRLVAENSTAGEGGAAAPDGGLRPDAATRPDAGFPADAATRPDAGFPADAVTRPDSGIRSAPDRRPKGGLGPGAHLRSHGNRKQVPG